MEEVCFLARDTVSASACDPSFETGLTQVVSTAICAPCHKGSPFAGTSTRRESASGTSCSCRAKENPTFPANPGGGPFQMCTAQTQNARHRASGPVVSQRIEAPPTSALFRRVRQRQPQPPKQHHAHALRGHTQLRRNGKRGDGT